MPEQAQFEAWIPFRIRPAAHPPRVDWCYVGSEKFTAPFFGDTIERCLRKPFNQLFLRETAIDVLEDRAAAHPGLQPTAFIFHGSRCGSTLLAQMAAAVPETIVLSEAAPIDDVLRAAVVDDVRSGWLRSALSVLGYPRAGERRLIVKLDAWHVLHARVIQEAFPGVPSVFLYRDPEEVLASQLRMPGIHMVPGMLDGITDAGSATFDREEHVCRVLAVIYAAAVAEAAAGTVSLMNYADLPGQALAQVLEWCRPENIREARERLLHVAGFDAKTPSLTFEPRQRVPLSARSRELVREWVSEHYTTLEKIRQSRSYL